LSTTKIYTCDGCVAKTTQTPAGAGWLKGRSTGSAGSRAVKSFTLSNWDYDLEGFDYCSKQCALEAQSRHLGFAVRST
jgi:hypothetical protein